MTKTFEFRAWESKSELRAHLDALARPTIVVGDAAESPRRFYSCLVDAPDGPVEIGLISTHHGPLPAMVMLDHGRILLVGHDLCLTWIRLVEPAIVLERQLDGVFYEFLPVGRDDAVVVLHELGALRVDASGCEAWRVSTDVVGDFRVDESGDLVLSMMEQSQTIAVSLETGAVRR